MLRVGYYTSVVGDDNRLAAVQTLMADCSYGVHGAGMRDYYGTCQINPRVFKKAQRSNKSRLVDINITIDVMRHACARDIDVVYLLSGDGDFRRACSGGVTQRAEVLRWRTVFRFGAENAIHWRPIY